jgi:hypothetical protein
MELCSIQIVVVLLFSTQFLDMVRSLQEQIQLQGTHDVSIAV